MNQEKIGRFLAELRKKENLTQEALGDKIGVTNKTISRWENGTYMPDIEMFIILSKFYNVSLNELLCGEYLKEDSNEKIEDNIIAIAKDNNKLTKKVMTMTLIIICLCLSFLSIFAGAFIYERHKMLYPDSYKDFNISKKNISNDLLVKDGVKGDYLWNNDNNDISVYLSAQGYNEEIASNLLVKENSFISIRTYYTTEYPYPLTAELNKYFNNKGIYLYTGKCLFAMKYKLEDVSIFSSETDIDIAAGCRMMLASINFPNKDKENYGYVHRLKGKWNGYIVSNGTPGELDTVWSVILEDKNRLIFITVKDIEICESVDTISEWLSHIELE